MDPQVNNEPNRDNNATKDKSEYVLRPHPIQDPSPLSPVSAPPQSPIVSPLLRDGCLAESAVEVMEMLLENKYEPRYNVFLSTKTVIHLSRSLYAF